MRQRAYVCAALALLTAWSGIAMGAAKAQPLVNKDKWGLSDDSGLGDPSGVTGWGATAFARGSEAGFGFLRYWLYWSHTNPSPGVYDWTAPDSEINGAISNGFQVYGNIMWAPEWAVQGTRGYYPWHCYDDQDVEPNDNDFVMASGCEIPRPDQAAFTTYVREAVRHYGNRIRYWGFWNEPNYPFFWHSTYNDADPTNEANYYQNLKDLVDYVIIPGAEAVRAENPNALIVGPEVDAPLALNYILEREVEYRNLTGRNLFDVISFHKYPTGDASSFGAELDDFLTWGGLNTYRAGRPVWVSESRATTPTVFTAFEAIEQRSWIQRFFYHGYMDGHCLNPDADVNACYHWYSLGTPSDGALIDRIYTRLPGFFKVKSFIAEGRMFDEQAPATTANATPGYEVATQLSASKNGTITALRFYRAPGETGSNTVRLWTDTGVPLATATYSGTGTGWQQLAISPVSIAAGTRYRVSFNTNTVQGKTNCGLGSGVTNGFLTAHQGFWGQPMGAMPTNASCSNFFADVVFVRGHAIFTTQTPASFGAASPGYEVATQLSSSRGGVIKGLRFYRAPGETGDNVLRLWTDTGTLLASARFVDNGSGASGWQQVSVGGVPISAGVRYRVSVNTNTMQSKTNCGLGSGLTNGPLTAHQGFWGQPMGSMPTNGSCSNFFVDVVLE
jgi:uncharacterized protein DUF4082